MDCRLLVGAAMRKLACGLGRSLWAVPVLVSSFVACSNSRAARGSMDGVTDGGVTDGDTSLPTVAVLVTPTAAHVAPGNTALFSATVTGTADASVVWNVAEGPSGGAVTPTGLYTAPATPGTYHVVAQSHAAPTVTASATVIVASVGDCAALPAPGAWDPASIAPVAAPAGEPSYEFVGKSMAVIADPFDPSTVWLGTGQKGLFRSTDCGATWTHVNTGTNGSALDQSSLWSMVIDPVNQGVIYTVAAYGVGGLWKSTNGGVDWTQLVPPSSMFAKLTNNFVANVSMDPSNPQHLAVTSHGVCTAPFPLGCIAETFDGGETWPNIVSMPTTWGENGGVYVINPTTWLWGSGDTGKGTYVTTDNGKTWTQARAGGAGDGKGENTMQPLERATDGAYYVPSAEGVLRSTDGVAWSLAWGQKNFQSAAVTGIALTPTTIYASQGQAFYSAPLDDFATWAPLQGPAGYAGYASFLAYDQAHHVLYVSGWEGGLFRYVTP
jgi:hypothetical protein